MAEIHTTPRSSPSWPLIVLGIVVVLLLGWWFATPGQDEAVTLETPVGAEAPRAETAVPGSELGAWLNENVDAPSAGGDAAWVASGLRVLADALVARAPEGMAIADRAADLRDDAAAIADASAEADLGLMVRDAFQTAGGLIAGMRTHNPDIGEAATRVVDAAAAVQRDVPLERQRDEIRTFFERANTALAYMTPRTR